MDLFNEIDDLSDLFLSDKNTKLDSAVEEYEDLQSRYSSLHEDYAKEIENSKKVEKCLVKCLKFYSKLCKKYEAQQKLISSLENTIKEKIISLEEAQRNEEKMKGLIQVYRTERAFYVSQTNSDLRKDKEILLDICCRLIGESVRNNNIRNLTNLLLRKFKKDLDDEKLNLLKKRNTKFKNDSDCDPFFDIKSGLIDEIKDEVNFKTEEKYSTELEAVKVKEPEELDAKVNPLDLSVCKKFISEKKSSDEMLQENNTRREEESQFESSLPSLEEVSLPRTDTELCSEPNLTQHFEQTARKSPEPIGQVLTALESSQIDVSRSDTMGTCVVESEVSIPAISAIPKCPIQSEMSSGSIFDVSDPRFNDCKLSKITTEQEDSLESQFGLLFEREGQTKKVHCKENGKEEEQDEDELYRILREMSAVRLPSPVEEIVEVTHAVASKSYWRAEGRVEGPQKRNSEEESASRSKKVRPDGETLSGGLLDSIMSAMSLQNEEFRAKVSEVTVEGAAAKEVSCRFSSLGTKTYSRRKKPDGGVLKDNSSATKQSSRNSLNRQQWVDSLVMEEIKNFVSSSISSKEEADKNMKHCLSVLASKSEEVIAKCIVAIVLENVDEVVETFERPAPPLTKTQHRLIVLLSVLRTLEPSSESVSTAILSIIPQKLFPDNFFWPDDSLEAATRFYAALCRARNDPKTLWKFCLQAMTDMRQRCPLLVFTVLKTWPDVLYDAATLKNNMLAVTIVNIFLHMPKTEGLRNFNQGRKLIALKHLLMNFYQFKVEETIEGFAGRVVEGLRRQEAGAEKAAVLLVRCRDPGWALKHVVPGLRAVLDEWTEGKTEDALGLKVLSVMKQICPTLVQESTDKAKVKDVVLHLSEILTSGKKNHASEVHIIEVLLQLKQYPEARKSIREWIPKSPIEDNLRNEIINASAENILRELKLNKKKEAKSLCLKRRLKKQSKKSKGKKKKAKKRKVQLQSVGPIS